MFLTVMGSVFVAAVALGALYDHRARRRGRRIGVSTKGPLWNATQGPYLQGGKQHDWDESPSPRREQRME